jgi:hypothetical protein
MFLPEDALALINNKNDSRWKTMAHLEKWAGVYYGMSLHLAGACPEFKVNNVRVRPTNWFGRRYQELFDFFLMSRHPRESEITRNWRYSQYRPYTKAPFKKIIDVINGALFQDGDYSITLVDKADNDYIWGNNFSGRDLVNYIQWRMQSIMEDPNGYFVDIPKQAYYETTTTKIEPDVWFINSRDVMWSTDEDFIFKKDEIIWHINQTSIFRYSKKGTTAQYILHPPDDPYGGYYAHSLGYIPADIAGGIWNTYGFFESWLDKAKAIADDFIAVKSSEQLVDKEASHPWIVAASEDCTDCLGAGQRQIDCPTCPEGKELVPCFKCGGSGQQSRNPGDWQIVPADQMDKDTIKIVSPEIDINKALADKCKNLLLEMLKALNLDYIDQAQSGTAKDKDMETRYQFLINVSNDIYDRVLYNRIKNIIAYRNVSAVNGVVKPVTYDFTIVKPTQFKIKTAADLLGEYDDSTKAGMPTFIRSRQVQDYVDKQFGGDAVLKRKTSLIVQMDRMSVLPETAKAALVAGGAATVKDWQLSYALPTILDQLVREKGNDWFVNASYEQINVEVETIFATLPVSQVAPVQESVNVTN